MYKYTTKDRNITKTKQVIALHLKSHLIKKSNLVKKILIHSFKIRFDKKSVRGMTT